MFRDLIKKLFDQDINERAEKDSEDDHRPDLVQLFLPMVGAWCFTHRIPNAIVVFVNLRFHDVIAFCFQRVQPKAKCRSIENHRRFFNASLYLSIA